MKFKRTQTNKTLSICHYCVDKSKEGVFWDYHKRIEVRILGIWFCYKTYIVRQRIAEDDYIKILTGSHT